MSPAQPTAPSSALPEPAKPWWQSRAILGGVTAVLSGALTALLGWDVGSENVDAIVLGLASAAGGAVAIYGRCKAQGRISGK